MDEDDSSTQTDGRFQTSEEIPVKKIVLTFGLIAGVVLSAEMVLTIPFMDEIGFNRGLLVGYTTMVLAFLLIYFGIRTYRDNSPGGTVSFGRAFTIGILIGVIASACYVATWEVYFFNFAPDFMDKYNAQILEEARAKGETPKALAKKKVELEESAERYKNPLINSAATFAEPLPVALIVSLVSAGMLSRRRKISNE
jgi:hypothetical protein